MTEPVATEGVDEERLYAFLMTPRAVRACAEAIYASTLSGLSAHFTLDESRLPGVVELVADVTRAAYPDVRLVPLHGRLRHFDAGGVPRTRRLETRLAGCDDDELLRARFELVITSVLLDAGAGPGWSFREDPSVDAPAGGGVYSRSEGLAVASYHWFLAGGLSSLPGAPRADALGLEAVTAESLGAAFQVSPANPLVGAEGRASLMRRLGAAVRAAPSWFGVEGRLGELGVTLKKSAIGGVLDATALFAAVQDSLGPIWPGRASLAGKNLGDVWLHPSYGLVPLHKLVQWLTYSLCEPLAAAGVRVVNLDGLTGLAEYRNGGLFVDAGVLVPRDPGVLGATHAVSSELVIEWRSLTVALLDRTVAALRVALGVTADELPLASALEGGTWSAGRRIARDRRTGGGPPIVVESDGTVF